MTPPIPYFGLVVLDVKGIPGCVNHNSFDGNCRKDSFENILFSKCSHTMQSAITQKLFWSFLNSQCDSLLTGYDTDKIMQQKKR